MAATLNSDQEELTFFSFPIEKQEDTATINPVDGTPDILIWGKATDGTIDGDREIVDPEWSAKAIQQWADTGANVRMSHDPKRPVGKGQQVQITTDGHWVKSLICDPLAKHFVRQKVLNDYSVGISEPDFRYRDPKLDPQGKALRVITGRQDGRSRIAEISICDRGSNFNSSFRIVKSAEGFTGEMVGDEDEIAKAAPSGLLTKLAHDDDGFVNVDLPRDASISISPADFARLHTFKQQLVTKAAAGTEAPGDLALKAVMDAESAVYKRDIDAATRRRLAGQGHALADGSYPIETAGDLHNAAHLARTGHGNAEAAKKLIARRARELGVANPLDGDSDSTSKGIVTATDAITDSAEKADAPEAQDAATPDVTKEPETAAPATKKAKKPKGGKKKLPPWLNKPADDDGEGGDDDGGADDASKFCKQDHTHTEKCHVDPATAAGVQGADMNPAPVGELLETPPPMSAKGGPTPQSASAAGEAPPMTPAPQHREPDGAIVEPFEKDAGLPANGQGETPTRLEAGMMKSSPEVAAILRFKRAGVDTELGRLHDLTCPAFHPDETAKCHPFADLATLDEGFFQRKAVEAACGPSLEAAKGLHLAWQAAHVLRETDPGVLNDFRLAAHKAFRDANPGPSSAPTPGMMTPGKYNRPCITEGHAAESPGYGPPNTSPQVATNAPDAHSFDRPPLSAGHQSPSPSFMKASFEYPAAGDGPVRLNYAVMEKERARHALMQMHEHLSRQFPEVCPIDLDAPPVQPESRSVPAAVGKSAGGVIPGTGGDEVPAVLDNGYVVPAQVAATFKAPVADDDVFADDEIYKGFKKMRKKLGKKVLAGKMTVDEARTHLGRQFAQKGAAEPQEAVQKGTIPGPAIPAGSPRAHGTGADPEVIKAAVREALRAESVPLEAATITASDPEVIKAAVAEATTELKDLLVKQQETFTAKLAEQQKVIDAIADQPDPSTAAFSGLAFNPLRTNKSRRPAAVPDQAEIAERTQQMVMRTLQDKVNSSSDPFEREAYYGTLAKMRGYSGP